uniref:Beta-1,4-N-acetylgalactosaminyltransferase n=1 Tax=Scleropages formosus TaxID=113540 RepID=A0A8C9R0X5_SCLFO
MLRFPVKKIRKQFKLLLLLVLLTFAVWFTYLHINQGKAIKLHFSYGKGKAPRRIFNMRLMFGRERQPCWESAERAPRATDTYKGQANLHVFEDWCGASVDQLRKNLHFPLYPHTRTTLKKLAVAPKWKNYGLRIFGFLHPYKDGDFQFAIASDDNSEFWLSPDDNPLNARMLVYVGRLGSEWTAPGEFTKFRSQSSKAVHLISSRRYYFEVLHKQDDKGSDHVEVGWRPFLPGLKYEVVDSAHISLYADESGLKMNSVDHIPQTPASHSRNPADPPAGGPHGADMLRPDPRDTFYRTPMIESSRLENVLPACLYSPTYVVKDFPIARYQGLQFVYLSFVFPNDFTRLTHMEKENKCVPETRLAAAMLYLHPARKHGGGNSSSPTRSSTAASFFRSRDRPRPTAVAGPNSSESALSPEARVTSYMRTSEITESRLPPQSNQERGAEQEAEPEEGGLSDYTYEEAEPRPGWAEDAINWQRTFSVNTMDFELLRSDWNDLRCNVSGNLQLAESEVVDVLSQYMEKLNERNGGIYTLLRIINVEKRRDSARGNRYLVELELMERGKRVVRLSQYIYLLLHRGRLEDSLETVSGPALTTVAPPAAPRPSARGATQWSTAYTRPLLCQPVMLQWRHDVMVHFVVPVKNQARWVQQFISDMELLHRETKDENFSIIIVDFQSEDMDVEQALRDSTVPRYRYLRREGNFERSAGLQVGVDTIEDSHSIVFLCDLHIHFPHNILESIRKHCVEGRLAYAPIVMRLGCGSSPQEPDGYWEVNGFGLFGIYKSDFDKVGGMNTEEFKDRWGGEDWELLDRVLQNGLEVERLRLRNFFHYYHSKRGMWNAQARRGPKG